MTSGEGMPTAPRTRWAAAIWGVLFAAAAIYGLWLFSDDDRRTATTDWAMSLTPTMILTIVLLTVGVLVLVAGAAGLIRHAQRRIIAQGADT
jgi:hypothetical protein